MQRPALVLAVAATLLLAGCMGGGGSDTTPEMSDEAKQLQEQSIAAMEDVDTYRMELTMDLESEETSVSVDADGVLNRPERRLRMNMSMDAGPRSVDTTVYIVGETAYVNARGMWQTRDVSDRDLWDQNARLEQQRELMEAARLEIVGNETVDGVPVRVVEFHIPDDKLDELTALAQQQAQTDQGEITDATYTAYIAQETGLMRKMEVDLSMEVEGQSVDGTVTMSFHSYGTDTNITVPEAATTGSSYSAIAPSA